MTFTVGGTGHVAEHNALSSVAGTLGSVKTNGTPDSAAGWGLVIDKNSATRVGSDSGTIAWSVAGVRKWDIGMDTGDVQMALLYDFVGSGVAGATAGDLIRVAPGGYFLMARNAGPATPSWRLQMNIDSHDDPTNQGHLKLARGAGAPGLNFILGHDDDAGIDCFNIIGGATTPGKASFGVSSSSRSSLAWLETKGGVVAWSSTVGKDPFLMLSQENGANARTWLCGVDQASGVFYIKDNTTGNGVIQAVAGALTATIHAMAGGVVNFGAAPTTTTAPAAGGAGALPATPLGYMTIAVGGTNRKVAYY